MGYRSTRTRVTLTFQKGLSWSDHLYGLLMLPVKFWMAGRVSTSCPKPGPGAAATSSGTSHFRLTMFANPPYTMSGLAGPKGGYLSVGEFEL